MISTRNKVFFRADGDSKIGLGHVMRCAALSQMLKKDFDCFFVISRPNKEVVLILENFGQVISLLETNKSYELLEFVEVLHENDIVVLDGYFFNQEYIKAIKKQVKKIVQIDDFVQGHFISDLIINHANSNLIESYDVSLTTQVLCGFDYLILREEFLQVATKKTRKVSKNDTVFICMGGADPNNITLKVLQSCVKVGFVKNIIVVVGAAYIFNNQLVSFISENFHVNIITYTNLNAVDLIELISSAEICICPASSIALEVCCVKSGLITGITVDNQQLIHEQLKEGNYAETIEDFNEAEIDDIVLKIEKLKDLSNINSLIKNQSKFADGKSGERILKEFKKLENDTI